MTVTVDDTNLKAIADAIRAKNGTEETYKPSEMSTAIMGIQGGGSATEDGMIDGSVTAVDNDRVTFVREEAFYYCEQLESLNLPNLEEISYYSFGGCSSLATVNVPKLQVVGDSAFSDCESLESIDLPEATMIGERAFESCTSLTDVNMPKVVSIGAKAFQDCTSLKKIYIPACCTTIDASATYDSPFYGLYNNNLQVYCGASAKPSGWGQYWDYTSTGGSKPTVHWGITPSEYAAL